MANTVSAALNPEIWTNRIQVPLVKSLVALEVCDTTLEKDLSVGDKVHFPYIGTLSAEDYTPGTALTAQDFTAVDDYIDVQTFKAVPFYVDDIRKLQAKPDYQGYVSDDAAYQLKDAIDATALAQVSAGVYFGDTSGTAGTYITGTSATVTAIASTTANIDNIFSSGRKWLRKLNVPENGDWIAIMRPEVAEDIELMAISAGFNVADSTLRNGYAGDFMGFRCYVSNNMTDGHMYLGKRGGINVIVQQPVKVKISDAGGSMKIGTNFMFHTVFGVKTFHQNAFKFLDAHVTS